jgi:DNA-binding MarR family transcriptional regulator
MQRGHSPQRSKSKLTNKEGLVLGVLINQPDQNRPVDIARITGYSLDDVMATLARLEGKGYVDNTTARGPA